MFFKLLSYFLLRMSLAMYAAPFDNNIDVVNNKDYDTPIGRKRVSNNKTQKRMPKENNYSEKVNSVLQTIHNLPEQDDGLGDFNPIPPPRSVGVEQTRLRENTKPNVSPDNSYSSSSSDNSPIYNTEEKHSDHYERFIPNYQAMYNTTPENVPSYNGVNSSMMNHSNNMMNHSMMSGDKNDILIEKLNYMINLLEEQQDEKTNNVTEEVVLYSFLGIFIIFIVDSFARVGKYVR